MVVMFTYKTGPIWVFLYQHTRSMSMSDQHLPCPLLYNHVAPTCLEPIEEVNPKHTLCYKKKSKQLLEVRTKYLELKLIIV